MKNNSTKLQIYLKLANADLDEVHVPTFAGADGKAVYYLKSEYDFRHISSINDVKLAIIEFLYSVIEKNGTLTYEVREWGGKKTLIIDTKEYFGVDEETVRRVGGALD